MTSPLQPPRHCWANPPWLQTWNGATPPGLFCTLPAGHPGDHRSPGVRHANPHLWAAPPQTWPRINGR